MVEIAKCLKKHLINDLFCIITPGTLELVRVKWHNEEYAKVAKFQTNEIPIFLSVLNGCVTHFLAKKIREEEDINIENSKCSVTVKDKVASIVIANCDKTSSITLQLKRHINILLIQLRTCVQVVALCTPDMLSILEDAGKLLATKETNNAQELQISWAEHIDLNNCLSEICRTLQKSDLAFLMRVCFLNLEFIDSFYAMELIKLQLDA
jgi:hypothetical protein